MAGLPAITIPPMICCHGLEPEPLSYVAHEVHLFREVRRVLRDDGCLFLNLGDSYAAGGGIQVVQTKNASHGLNGMRNKTPSTKPKDMLGIPWRVAFALQADGWTLRCDVVWEKPNPMPESVTDRPTKAHEYIFLFSKGPRYFYDIEAVKEACSENTHLRVSQATLQTQTGGSKQEDYRTNEHVGKKSRDRTPAEILKAMGRKLEAAGSGTKNNDSMDAAMIHAPMSRNQRSVWRITTEPFKGAHFATFPTEIPRRAILAGTSACGCCAECGTPWERTTEQVKPTEQVYGERDREAFPGRNGDGIQKRAAERPSINQTTGWQPACTCRGHFALEEVVIGPRVSKEFAQENWGADSNGEYNGQSTKGHTENGVQDASGIKARIIRNATEPRRVTRKVYRSELPIDQHPIRPCQVLDPFLGSGTTAQVALELGRHVTGIEIAPHYHEFINDRTSVTVGLPGINAQSTSLPRAITRQPGSKASSVLQSPPPPELPL